MSLKTEFDELIEGMSIDDMPNGDMKLVAQECGVKVAIALLKKMNGTGIYIPKMDAFCKIIKGFVLKNFNSSNAKELAITCNISQRKVYEIIEEEDERRKSGQKIKLEQLNMFKNEDKSDSKKEACYA